MAPWPDPYASTAATWTNWVPPGHVEPKRLPRCGCCGRFIKDAYRDAPGVDSYDLHLERDCPHPCYYSGDRKRPVHNMPELMRERLHGARRTT